MERQATCEERIDAELAKTLEVLRDLWAHYTTADDPDEYHPEHETNLDEYGLSFDWVEPETFNNQSEGYYRYQLSWGGPSDEFRFYVRYDGVPYRIAYHFMDWFDGARRDVTGDEIVRDIFDWLAEGHEEHKQY